MTIHNTHKACLAGLAATLLAGTAASAAPLLDASSFVQCFADGNSSFHATDCTQGGFIGVPPSAFASATLSPVASVSVEVTSPPAAVLGAGADATLLYRFAVTGGTAGDVVPIVIDYAMGVFATPDSLAVARLLIYTSALLTTHAEEIVCDPQSCDETTRSDSLNLQAVSGYTLNSVTLYAQAQARATRASHELARAFADPHIFVDPTFPNASLYSIVVSPGVGNLPRDSGADPAPVPEPAALSLVGAALGLFSVRRRRSASPRG